MQYYKMRMIMIIGFRCFHLMRMILIIYYPWPEEAIKMTLAQAEKEKDLLFAVLTIPK